ncbi:hypothetical protein [Persicirhabdus sediminis]|uniref:Uncharacterized protein n=1 Tax=Persicirhabdus sediminis TaxID=454144 RepID=A0A8J7MB52_9BACT|nr:hypothetical protein [Persicirhabdus sediminis]MBK1789803.1 hypothetical protein [Persicirhabdus sediminis]
MLAASAAEVPDFEKAFAGEAQIVDTKMMGMRVLGYSTEKDPAEIKKQLKEFLGDSWGEVEILDEMMEGAKGPLEAQGMELLAMSNFTSKEISGLQVMCMLLTAPQLNLAEGEHMLQLMVMGLPEPEKAEPAADKAEEKPVEEVSSADESATDGE